MMTGAEYLAAVRFALRHLYDPNALRLSPLLELFGLAQRVDPLGSLRQVCISTIQSMEPPAETPTHSRLWRIYEILLYRFVQQCAQEEVADQLGISVRHLRREEREAIEVLAHRLAEKYKLEVDWAASPAATPSEDGGDAEETPAIADELAWVQKAAPGTPVALERLLGAVNELLQPLANRHRVHLEVTPPAAPLRLGGQEVVLRQILILVLTGAIHQAGGGTVQVKAHAEGPYVQITVRGSLAEPRQAPARNEDNLAMVHQLVSLCGGRLELGQGQPFLATLHLPTSEQVPVLVIDDNEDTLRLLERYTADTRYKLVGAKTVDQAFALAQETSPQLILLDVMMPGVDGWELLGRLSQHPVTAGIPIIVCTILAQEELALSLGAVGFLHKPVSRQELLEALNRYLQPTQPS